MACHEGSHLLMSVMRWGCRRQQATGPETQTLGRQYCLLGGVTPQKVPTSWSCDSCSRRRLSSLSFDAMIHSSWIILSSGESRPAMFGLCGRAGEVPGVQSAFSGESEGFLPFSFALGVKMLQTAKPQGKTPMGHRWGKPRSANCFRFTFESCKARHSDCKRIIVPDHPDHCCVALRQHRGLSCSVCPCL